MAFKFLSLMSSCVFQVILSFPHSYPWLLKCVGFCCRSLLLLTWFSVICVVAELTLMAFSWNINMAGSSYITHAVRENALLCKWLLYFIVLLNDCKELTCQITAWNNSATTVRIFMNLIIWGVFEGISRKLLLLLLLTAIELSLGGSSPYTSTDKTNNKYT
jgi:hypothetical protein